MGKNGEVYHEYDPYLIITGKPGKSGYSKHFGKYRLNSDGFRSKEIREKNGLRIAVIGGSAVWGSGCTENEKTFPSVIEKELRSTYGVSCEAINAGVGAYFSFQELVLIVKKVVHLNPDIVIIHNGYNDAFYYCRQPEKSFQYNEVELYHRVKGYLGNYKVNKNLDIISKIFRKIRFSKNMNSYDQNYKSNLKGIKNYFTNMEMMTDVLVGQGIKVLIGLQPYLPLSTKKMTEFELKVLKKEESSPRRLFALSAMLRRFESGLTELCGIKGVTFCSFLSAFENVSSTCFFDHVHLNDVGNQNLGEKYSEMLAELIKNDMGLL